MKTASQELDMMQRLEKLEKQNRRFKVAATLGVILAGALLVMGQAPSKNRIIEAQGFVLRDNSGTARAELGIKDGSVGLYLYNPQRFKNLKAAAQAAGTEIKDPPEMSLQLSPDGSPSLTLGVRFGGPFTELFVSSEGGVGLRAHSKEGNFVGLYVSDGRPSLWFKSANREVQLGYSQNNQPQLNFYDMAADGQYRLLAGIGTADPAGIPFVFVHDKQGNPAAALSTMVDGPALIFYDEKGEVVQRYTVGKRQ